MGQVIPSLLVLVLLVLVGGTLAQRPYVESSPLDIIALNRNPIYDFATNLYLTVGKAKGADENMLISPFSIRAITGLIYLASRGM